ncbi:hypothetical protein [Vallitalea maricola]|uniref:Uncharacterized protein n=1 Tax=Vallitalea maricola TaxID=3074433 RepID=A0ACB5UJF1_9FIRM|nr:hypothetical protein AN2V17_19050 [Vallitalea sp. AN17-2]
MAPKIIGIIVLSILTLINFFKLLGTLFLIFIQPNELNFESGFAIGSTIGSVLMMALFIFGIVKISKSLSTTNPSK